MTHGFSYSAGTRGKNRVRVFAHWRTGGMYADFLEDGHRKRTALGRIAPELAKQYADTLAERLAGKVGPAIVPATVGQLFDKYMRSVTPTKAITTQQHDRTTLARFVAHVGTGMPVIEIREDHARSYLAARRAQGRDQRPGVEFRALSDRSLDSDLRTIKAVFAWAVRNHDLDRHPIDAVTVTKQDEVKRPALSPAEYVKLSTVAPMVGKGCDSLLALVWETGHRVGAVRSLRWEDVQLDQAVVTWVARFDKKRKSHQTPLSPAAVDALRRQRRLVGTVGPGWVFPSPQDKTKMMSRDLARDWWARLEKLSELERIDGRGWHSIRRTFSIEVRHLPLKDAMQLGGWSDVRTFVETYQPVDLVQLKVALDGRRSA